MEQILQFGRLSFYSVATNKNWGILFTILCFFTFQSLTAQNIVANRTVSNTHHCSNNTTYGAWLNFSGINNYYQINDGSFIEYDNGTAHFTGIIVNNNNSSIKFSIDVTFSGRTYDPPTNSPKANDCYNEDTSDWYYYPTTEGTLTGLDYAEGAQIELVRAGPSFQAGTGANVTDGENFNASGWLTLTINSQPTTGLTLSGNNGDFNIRLSGESIPQCDNITDGGQIGFDPNCTSSLSLANCNDTPSTIEDCISPSGGSGDIEYVWLKSTTATSPPTSMTNDPDWTVITGATGASYSPDQITETTYYFRCSRRAGCSSYPGEANMVTITCDDTVTETTVCSSIANSSDDAEENTANGAINLTSGDIELMFDNGNNANQIVGLRFLNLNIPRGAVINNADIQFTSEATINQDPSLIIIRGEASDDAPTFSNVINNISSRDTTDAFVTWSPPVWETTNVAGPDQKTEDISSLIQEIIDRPGYTSNSAISIIFRGIGKRTAISFNANPDAAPELCITFTTGCNDSDNDGVCDEDDICEGFDDNIDTDGDGTPDGCDTECPEGTSQEEISGYAIAYLENNGVYGPECIINAPDRNYANFYDHQDNIIVKFDDIIKPGSEYSIIWKKRDYSSSYPGPAKLDIYESEDGVNFTFNSTITTSSTSEVETTIITSVNTMFLKLVNASSSGSGSPDFKIDAIGYLDFICVDSETAKIGNFVWKDTNRDGIQGDNEPGIEGVFVFLEDEFGNPVPGVSNELTDEDGMYMFSNLAAGNYKVRFATPENFTPTAFNEGPDRAVDSDANPFDGRSFVITLAAGEINLTIDAGYHENGPLPVELINFTAKLIEGNKVQLDWATESEENNNFFVIERSTDGDRFLAIGTVEGNGTSSFVNTYEFIDKAPFFGRNYYRLKQVDYDGKYDFSPVESVVLQSENLPDVIIYPNPTKDFTSLRVVSPFEQAAKVEIINGLGQILETLSIEQGANDLQIDLRKYQPGFYYINIQYDGFKKLIHRVLKVED